MDFLTTKGKILFGVVFGGLLIALGFMTVTILILVNQNHHLAEENELLHQKVQLMIDSNELGQVNQPIKEEMKK
jgi:fructose-specific phosphotransferase system IIC component